ITSRWIQSAPAWSTARTSSPSLEKSDARIDGAITSGRGATDEDMAIPRTVIGVEASPNMGPAQGQIGCTAIAIRAASSAFAASIAGIPPLKPLPGPLFYRCFFYVYPLAHGLLNGCGNC